MRSIPAVVAAAVGAAIATACLIGPTTFTVFIGSFVSSGSLWDRLYDSAAATAAVGALAAFVAAVVLRHSAFALGGAAVGLVGLMVLAVTATPGQGVGYPTAIASGLVLGGLAVATRPSASNTGRGGQIGLAVGVVAGFLLAQSVPFSPDEFGGNRRYADYLPGDLVSTQNGTGVTTLVGAFIALIALALFALQARGTLSEAVERPGTGVVVTCVCVPIASFLIRAWMRESTSDYGARSVPSWVFSSVLILIVLAAALVMPGRTGMPWVGVATLVSSAVAVAAAGGSWVSTLIVVALIGLGAFAARWRAGLPIGIAVLVVAVLLQLTTGESTELISIVGALFLVPVAVSYTVSVCASEHSDTTSYAHPAILGTALAAAVPLRILGGGSDFGWTAYTPLTDVRWGSGYFDIGSTTETTVTVSVLSLIAAGVVAWVITRRPNAHSDVLGS